MLMTSRFKSRANPSRLVELANAENDELGLVTRYLAYECYRTRLDECHDINGNLLDKLDILYWYIGTYGPHRKAHLPLSASQIAFLNSPMPIIGLAFPISIIAFSFIRNELGHHWNLSDERIATEAAYWWAIERSPQLFIEDRLVPPNFTDLLTRINITQRWLPYHTNYFLERYRTVHPELQYFDLEKEADRAAYLAYMICLAAERPYLTRYLPAEPLRMLLRPGAANEGSCVFDSVLALSRQRILGTPKVDSELVAHAEEKQQSLEWARTKREAILAAARGDGFLAVHGLAAESRRAANTIDVSSIAIDSIDVDSDVVLIGPVNAASGLGQASRLSKRVLGTAGIRTSVVNFDMDNPAPTGFSSGPDHRNEPIRPGQINLLHLNAESVPLAFAYLDPDCYTHSYNIGYFFWELTKPPKCHHLALEMLDEIWVSSEYTREIYHKVTSIPVTNVGMAVEPLPSFRRATKREFGFDNQDFLFLTTFDAFSFVQRKNPLGVIRAFQTAFPDLTSDVKLIIKTQNRHKVDDPHQAKFWTRIQEKCNRDPRLILINETMAYADLLSLKVACDCYVSLHRSEGWGFGMIEAMQLGVPVIATGYSGNLEFCTEKTSLLVDYDLVEPQPNEYIFVERGSQWAEPNVEHAAAHMRTLYAQRSVGQWLAEIAQRNVAENFSLMAIGSRYAQRLGKIRKTVFQQQTSKRQSDRQRKCAS